MFVYGVTVKIEPAIEAEFVRWMKEEHLPEVMDTGHFSEVRFMQLMEPSDLDGLTYSVQYGVADQVHYETYLEQEAQALRQKTEDRFGGKFVAFRTFLDVLYSEQQH